MHQKVRREVAEAFRPLTLPARYKGAHGGRGSGKSWFLADEAVFALLNGKDVVCVREVQNSIADSVKRLMENRIAHYGLQALFDITEKEIRCPTAGSYAIFRGMQNHTAASVKSLEDFDVAWWEEAQTASQKSLDLLIPTIRAPGSELWFGWNPENEDDPIDVFLRKNPPESAVVVEVNWDDNPWFPDELREDLERDRRRDPDKYEHIWNGAYREASEARVFRNWRIGEIEPPENVVWFYGVDWGFSNDPAAGVRFCFPDPETLYVRNEVYELGLPMEAHPAFLAELPGSTQWPMRADNARPEIIDYCRRHGFPKIRAAKKGKGSVEDGVSFIQSFDVVVHPECGNTQREFQRYAYKTDARTGEILPVIEDKNNHAIDALRYGCEGLHRKGKLIEAITTPSKRPPQGHDYGFDEDDEEDSWKVA
ncbi:PBSX family phage terminase large subunit [Ruegeria sp. HKCCD6109]|uniref:PBSX family phage terminase large subunit n=1 Tax=Ruegeria sp. HKCCD6109 TaxID=2683017 RepID=UPI00209E4F3E|nr:PBSX family phage terminase large subunit [Ruegeria sp. HKCCD6109]